MARLRSLGGHFNPVIEFSCVSASSYTATQCRQRWRFPASIGVLVSEPFLVLSLTMTLLVTPVTTLAEFQEAKAIRLRVFHDEQGFDPVLEFDKNDDEPTTIHFLGKDVEQDKNVAVGRVLMDEAHRSAKIGRVAVLKECRGKNYGVALMEGMERHIRDRVDSFTLSAQLDKKGFYEKCGYQRTPDDIHLDEGVPHCWMVKAANS